MNYDGPPASQAPPAGEVFETGWSLVTEQGDGEWREWDRCGCRYRFTSEGGRMAVEPCEFHLDAEFARAETDRAFHVALAGHIARLFDRELGPDMMGRLEKDGPLDGLEQMAFVANNVAVYRCLACREYRDGHYHVCPSCGREMELFG